MSIELKPCPFCGQQPEVEEWSRGVVIAHRDCPVGVDSFSYSPNGDGFGVYFGDLESAAEAWNTRAERTCQRVLFKPTGVLVCSECGAGIPKQLDKYCYLHYCPVCGAKVVE